MGTGLRKGSDSTRAVRHGWLPAAMATSYLGAPFMMTLRVACSSRMKVSKRSGCHRQGLAAELGHALFHIGLGQGLADLLVELVDHVARRLGRRSKPIQKSKTKPGTAASATVGTSGRAEGRTAPC